MAATQRILLPGELICDLVTREVEAPRRAILFLHGYLQSGPWILRKLGEGMPGDARLIAPSAPFPIPRRKEGRFQLGYSWYFYDPFQDEYFVDMKIAIGYLRALLERIGSQAAGAAASLPLTIVGYSQGGYLAPLLAEALLADAAARGVPLTVEKIIGVSCRFLEDEFSVPLLSDGRTVPMDAIHGECDEAVPIGPSRDSHAAILRRGGQGEFFALPGVGHFIEPQVQRAVVASTLWARFEGTPRG